MVGLKAFEKITAIIRASIFGGFVILAALIPTLIMGLGNTIYKLKKHPFATYVTIIIVIYIPLITIVDFYIPYPSLLIFGFSILIALFGVFIGLTISKYWCEGMKLSLRIPFKKHKSVFKQLRFKQLRWRIFNTVHYKQPFLGLKVGDKVSTTKDYNHCFQGKGFSGKIVELIPRP